MINQPAPIGRRESRPVFGQLSLLAIGYLAIITIAMIAFGPSPYLYGAFAICAAIFILPCHYLTGAAALIILTIFFERFAALQGLVINHQVYKFYLIDIVICLSLLAWGISAIGNRAFWRKRLSRLGWPEYALAVWLAIVAAYLIRSLGDINSDFAVAFSSFKNYFFYPLLYGFFAFSITSAKRLRDIVHLFLFGSAGLLVFLLIGVVNGAGLWTEYTPLSTAGVRYLAGTHAFYLCLAFVIAAALLAYERFRDKRLPLAIMSLWSVGIVLSLMRHLYLALACGLLSLFALAGKNRRRILYGYAKISVAALSALVLAVLMFSSIYYYSVSPNSVGGNFSALAARLNTISNLAEDSSASWRAQLWSIAKDEWLKNPVFGVGFGHSVLIETADYQNFEELRNIHNSPLAITVQMGLAGALSFAAFVLAVLIAGFKSIRSAEDPYAIGIYAAIIVFGAACFFQPYLETNLMGIWLYILLGLLRARTLIAADAEY